MVYGGGGHSESRLTQRVSCLQHEALDDPVEDDTIVVAIAGVCGPVLHSLGTLLREKLNMYVPSCAVDDSCPG